MREADKKSLGGVKNFEMLYSIRNKMFLNTNSVLFPPEDSPEFLFEEFHSLMMEEGQEGVEFVQESLHSGFFCEEFMSSPEDIRQDFELFRENC